MRYTRHNDCCLLHLVVNEVKMEQRWFLPCHASSRMFLCRRVTVYISVAHEHVCARLRPCGDLMPGCVFMCAFMCCVAKLVLHRSQICSHPLTAHLFTGYSLCNVEARLPLLCQFRTANVEAQVLEGCHLWMR